LILNGSINLFFAILAVNVEISVTLFRVLDFWIWLWIFLTNLGMINGEFYFLFWFLPVESLIFLVKVLVVVDFFL
jgi:hypothetical protein